MSFQLIGVNEAFENREYEWENDHIFVKTMGVLTDGRVSMVEDTIKPGFHLPRHHHKKMVEVFYMLEGELTMIFDDETLVLKPGMTLNVPTGVWHEAKSENGGKMLSLFSPSGFEDYLAVLDGMDPADFEDAAKMKALSEEYDTWTE